MKQGEIWTISLAGRKGSAKDAKHPVVIINDDTISPLPSRVIIPLVEWQDKFADAIWLIRIDPNDGNNLGRPSALDAFQLHAIPTKRFAKKMGVISTQELSHIKKAVKAIINVE